MVFSFAELKRTRVQQFEHLRTLVRPPLGSHKRMRLVRTGCGGSQSLLHDCIATEHGNLLARDYWRRFSALSREVALKRLRFLTVLHAVIPLEETKVIQTVVGMEKALRQAFTGSGTWVLGAVEVEVVNVSLLRRVGALSDDEDRKLNVLERIGALEGSNGILVHFHGVVDLGRSVSANETRLREGLAKKSVWRRSPYQIELKRLFSTQSVQKNLKAIASYVTKGGNENLRYNGGFGRDLDEDLDAKIWRKGEGRADKGAEKTSDERGLTMSEIAFLDDIWCKLMIRKRNRRGYLVRLPVC